MSKVKKEYYYVPCDGGGNVNQPYRHYFRLYVDIGDGKPKLVDQGLPDKIPDWETKYPGAELNVNNPYPTMD